MGGWANKTAVPPGTHVATDVLQCLTERSYTHDPRVINRLHICFMHVINRFHNGCGCDMVLSLVAV